jgi:ribonuclease HII
MTGRSGTLDLLPPEPSRPGEVEAWARSRGLGVLVGCDEAGRGPLAGPVVCAACALPDPCPIEGIDDSKRLDAAERERLDGLVRTHALAFAVVEVGPEEVDRLNILRASLAGMARAWEEVVRARPELRRSLVVVDGRDRLPLPDGVDQRPIVGGDARSLAIGAASILAKVARDRRMVALHAELPLWGFDRHKGYPTPQHLDALRRHGPSPIHRRSFRLDYGPAAPEGA